MAQLPSLRLPDVLDDKSDVQGWPFSAIKSIDGSSPVATYSTLAAMISGISAGQEARLNAETFSESVDISKAITMRGSGPAETLITKDDAFIVLTVSAAGAYIADLRVENVRSAAGALNAYGISVSGNDAVLKDIEAQSNPPNATSGNCYGIEVSGTDVRLEHCRSTADKAAMTQHGLHVSNGGSVTVVGGYYDGAEAGIEVESGATAILEGPRISSLSNSGTCGGWYIDDTSGDLVLLDHLFLEESQRITFLNSTDEYAIDATSSNHFRIFTPGNVRLRLDDNGNMGVGGIVPQGLMHGYDSISGFIHWEYDGLDATARTIIPNGAGDVIYGISFLYVVRDSAGGIITGQSGTGTTVNLSTGSGTIQVRINGDGSLDVRRTAGSVTFKVAFYILFM